MPRPGVDPFRRPVVALRWMRWFFRGMLVAGGALWWATGHWQWMVTLLAISWAVARGAVLSETAEVLGASRNAKQQPLHASPSERVADWIATFVLAAGLVSWTLTGWWWLAVIGVALCAATWVVTAVRQEQRNEKLIRALDVLLDKALDLGEQGRSSEAIAEYRRVVAEFGDDPRGRMREYIAIAWFNLAVELYKAGHSQDASDAYGQVIAKFHGDATPEVRKIVSEARMRHQRIGDAGHA